MSAQRGRTMTTQLWLWIGFGVFIAVMLAIDLGVVNRKAHVISVREGTRWTLVVVATAAIFNAWIFTAELPCI